MLISPSALASAWPTVSADKIKPDTTLEVQVDAGILQADYLREWVDTEARNFLDEQPYRLQPDEQLRITLDGALYDYRVTFFALRDSAPIRAPYSWICKCANEEVIEQIRKELPKFTPAFEATNQNESNAAKSTQRKTFGPLGVTGISLMALGGAGMLTGIVFVSLSDSSQPNLAERQLRDVRSFQLPGAITIVGGGGLMLTGAMLYLLRDGKLRRKREAAIALSPRVGMDGNSGVVVTGRF